RHEGPERPALRADGAVAGDHRAEVGGHVETHLPAVAAARQVLDVGHGWSRVVCRYNAGANASTREGAMPEVYVHAVKGRTPEQKKALIKDITEAVVKNFNAPADAVTITIVEAEANLKAKGGVLFSDMKR